MSTITKVLNDNILIKLDPESDKLGGGLLVKPEIAHDHVFRTGEVIATGPGRWAKKADVRIDTGVKPGDGVIFVKFIATHTKNAEGIQREIGTELALIKPSDVCLVYDRANPPEISQ